MKRKERLKEYCCCSLRKEMDLSRAGPVTMVHPLELGLKRRIQLVPLPALKVFVGISSCAWHSILFSRASVLSFSKRARAAMEASPHWQFISVDLAMQFEFATHAILVTCFQS